MTFDAAIVKDGRDVSCKSHLAPRRSAGRDSNHDRRTHASGERTHLEQAVSHRSSRAIQELISGRWRQHTLADRNQGSHFPVPHLKSTVNVMKLRPVYRI